MCQRPNPRLLYIRGEGSKGLAERLVAVLFGYNLHTRFLETVRPVKLEGLDAARRYRLTKINLVPGQPSRLPANGQPYSGSYLLQAGVLVSDAGAKPLTSHGFELVAEQQ